jgi:hypothetical protein
MSAFSQETDFDHGGGVGDDVTADHVGSPDLDIEITSKSRATAALHILDPAIISASHPRQ